MKLALRHTLPPSASTLHDVSAFVIETRLVSKFAHGGVVIGNTLYHSNASNGVHAEPGADLSGFLLIDLGDAHDARALALFEAVKGSRYDFFSLVAFVFPGFRDSRRYYCFELCYLLMTGRNPAERVTCETLILMALQMGGKLASPLPNIKSTEGAV